MNEALLKAIICELGRQDDASEGSLFVAVHGERDGEPLSKDVFVNGNIDLVALVNVIDGEHKKLVARCVEFLDSSYCWDKGPPGEGWQSDELKQLIKDCRAVTGET